MLTLSRLYSETGLFDEVRFHPGINIVLGRYSGAHRSVNGIGKSTLVRLIDYLLLGMSPAGSGKLDIDKQPFLQDHVVSLEFVHDGAKYTISRSFDQPRSAFFTSTGVTIDYTITELKEILGPIFYGSATYPGAYIPNDWFRPLTRFFIKDDLERRKQEQPTSFVSPQTRSTENLYYNFFLLGLPNRNLYEFDQVREEMRQRQNAKRDLERQIENTYHRTVGEMRREMLRVQDRISRLERSLQEFEFIGTYQEAETELNRLSQQVSEQLATYHSLQLALQRHLESYEISVEVDIERTARLYSNYSTHLGEFVQKTLKEVIEFREQLAENRRRFLSERERALRESLEKVTRALSSLEERRQRLYMLLNEKGAFDSIRHTYETLLEEKVGLERDNSLLTRLSDLDDSLVVLKSRSAQLAWDVTDDVRKSEARINDLRRLFDEILQNAFATEELSRAGYLDVSATPSKTVPVAIAVSVPKSASLGKHLFGILAYDLTVFFNLLRQERQLPSFLIHDGVFHGIDRKTVVNILNYVYRQTRQTPGFQYIITGNEDELVIASEKEELYGKYDFDLNQSTIATYSDIPERMIFKQEFE